MFDDLYQEVIIDHSKRPRNHRAMEDANRRADGHNQLCGDKLRLYLKLEDDRVADASFEGSGCAISTAAASLMTESLKGKTREESLKLLDTFHELLTTDTPVRRDLGKLVVFCGVREYPARVKCATLAWHTLKSALVTTTVRTELVTTELITLEPVTTELVTTELVTTE
ncbi:MAG: Fe-S cluster assembly sulfur transfer protein SufU [Vulcanimicrobiaceae bacterium]